MKKPLIIGLTGLAGTGKDTVRTILEEQGFNGLAFADPIRGMLREMLTSSGINDVYMDDRDFKEAVIPEIGVSYRHMAQTLGTEWGRRSLRHDFWLKLAEAAIASVQACGELYSNNFAISDVRFANEAEFVKRKGGVIWRITRCAVEPVRSHVSESDMTHIVADLTITNNGTIDDLRYAVQRAAKAALK